MLEHEVTDKWANKRIVTHETEIPEMEMRMVMVLVERWAPVAAIPDGEDSTGRTKLRLQTPAELVSRAFDCAALVMKMGREKKLFYNVGSLPPHDGRM